MYPEPYGTAPDSGHRIGRVFNAGPSLAINIRFGRTRRSCLTHRHPSGGQ